MPSALPPEDTDFLNPNAVSIMGRNSQLVAAALVESILPRLNRNADKQGRVGWRTTVMPIGDVGLALLRLEAELPEDDELETSDARPRSFHLREELYGMGLPSNFLHLEFELGDSHTPPSFLPTVAQHIVNLVEMDLRALDDYPTSFPPGPGGVRFLHVPRTAPAPSHQAPPPGRDVQALTWSQPLVNHLLSLEIRPSANGGTPVRFKIEVPPVGSHHQRAVLLRGFPASALLVFALRKMHTNITQFTRVPRDAPPAIRNHLWGHVATQSFLVLLLVETEEQASLRAEQLLDQHGRRVDVPEHLQHVLGVWEEKCTLNDAPTFAFDVLVHGAPDERELDLRQFNILRTWVVTILDPRPDKPNEPAEWNRSRAGRFAKDLVHWLARFWPSLGVISEREAGPNGGPRRAAAIRRLEKALGRVWELFDGVTAEELLEQRRREASTSSSASSTSLSSSSSR
ncbi:hypothetical protein JCM6882_009062 [Rhodosporidiobolus microsporus]